MATAHEAGLPFAAPKRHGIAGMSLWNAFAASFLVVLALVFAITLSSAFLFVSLGSILYEFVERPLARASCPRSTIVGNGLALLVGYAALAVFGLRHHPSTIEEGVSVVRGCAVVSGIALTALLLTGLKASHPPAGSTLLLVALGIEHRPLHLLYIFAGVVGLTAAAWLVNRLAGIPVPVWSSPEPAPLDAPQAAERTLPRPAGSPGT